MNLNRLDPEEYEMFMIAAGRLIALTMNGPEAWEKIPPKGINPNNVEMCLAAARKDPAYLDRTFIDNLRRVGHAALDAKLDQMERWAKDNGRTDMVVPTSERITAALNAEVEGE
jgi:hypothetical protein